MIINTLIKEKAEKFIESYGVSVVEWDTTNEGNVYAVLDACPYEDLHTTDTARTEQVRVYLEPNVKAHCFHKSCSVELAEFSKKLWLYLDKPKSQGGLPHPIKSKPTPAQQARIDKKRLLEEQKEAVISARDSGLIECMYGATAVWNNSTKLNTPYTDFIRRLFKPSDVLWSGDFNGSGQWAIDKKICKFATARELCDIGKPLFPFISNSTYKNSSTNRRADEVLKQKYIVLEWDSLTSEPPKDTTNINENIRRSGVLFNYVKDLLDLDHFATIFSGNKSLHFWCALPSDDKIEWLREVANELKYTDSLGGLDTACIGASQPCRTPSFYREDKGNEQKLVYLKPIQDKFRR